MEISKYKISISQNTIGGLILPKDFCVCIKAITKENKKYCLVTCTCKDSESDIPIDRWDKLQGSVLFYSYDSEKDNDKTENEMLTSTIEKDLTEWVGEKYWSKIK